MSWYDTDWDYRVEITVDNTQVDGDVSDFPVYVDLSDMPSSFFTNVDSAGADIRITRADGTTECAFELVSIDTGASTGGLHFKANFLSSSSDTSFKIYYGNASASAYAVDATYGRNNVWTDLEMVNHDGGSTVDSTGIHSMSAIGSPVSGGVSAPTGAGTSYNGTSQYVNTNANNLNVNNDYTLSAWINVDIDRNQSPIIGAFNSISVAPGYWIWINRLTSSNGYGLCMQLDNGPGDADSVPNSSNRVDVADGWSHIAMVRDGNDYKSYINGSLADSGTLIKGGLDTTSDILIARLDNGSLYFPGSISELRMQQSVKDADWISTEYNNQNSPSTFYTVGSEEAQPTADTFTAKISIF